MHGRACAATGISEVVVPMPIRVPGSVEVPYVGLGRYRKAHGRACSATAISAVGHGGPKVLFKACATAEVGTVGCGVPGTPSTVGSAGRLLCRSG